MNWDMFAVVAELVSAVGVILSLVYVGFQVQQNTRTMHASSLKATIGASQFVREQIVTNADVASLYIRGNSDPSQLTDEESVRYRILIQSIVWTRWNAYAQTQLTGLDESVFEAQKPFIRRVLSTPGGEWVWRGWPEEFEENFRAVVEEILTTPSAT